MKNKEIERRIASPMITIIPEATNHIIVKSRGGNAIDITSDPTKEDNIYIITSHGIRVTIKSDGTLDLEPNDR